MVQGLQASAVFLVDPDLIPSTHVEVDNCLYLQIQIESSPFFWPPPKLHAYGTQTHKKTKHLYNEQNR